MGCAPNDITSANSTEVTLEKRIVFFYTAMAARRTEDPDMFIRRHADWHIRLDVLIQPEMPVGTLRKFIEGSDGTFPPTTDVLISAAMTGMISSPPVLEV